MKSGLAPAVVNAHIVDGKITSAGLQGQSSASFHTRNGNELKLVRGQDGRFALMPQGRGRRAVEGHVVRADIPCSNGVIHLVDTVLIKCSPHSGNAMRVKAIVTGTAAAMIAAVLTGHAAWAQSAPPPEGRRSPPGRWAPWPRLPPRRPRRRTTRHTDISARGSCRA